MQALPHRTDTKLYRILTPQTPVARTRLYDKHTMDEFPNGTNMMVAVLAYTGAAPLAAGCTHLAGPEHTQMVFPAAPTCTGIHRCPFPRPSANRMSTPVKI